MKSSWAILCLVSIVCGCREEREAKKSATDTGRSAATEQKAPPATLPSDPALARLVPDYKSFKLMTPEPYHAGELSFACTPESQSFREYSRKKHGIHDQAYIGIFMNDAAATTFRGTKSPYPVGSIVLKQKQLRGIGGMIKRSPGYDSDHGDWEYFYFEDPNQVVSGKIASCVNCHAGASQTDYVFGSWAAAQK